MLIASEQPRVWTGVVELNQVDRLLSSCYTRPILSVDNITWIKNLA